MMFVAFFFIDLKAADKYLLIVSIIYITIYTYTFHNVVYVLNFPYIRIIFGKFQIRICMYTLKYWLLFSHIMYICAYI